MRAVVTRVVTAFVVLAVTAGYARGAFVCGDVNNNGGINTSDALLVLKKGVGQPVDLVCGPTGQPAQTGQTTCYKAGVVSACEGTGQDGELRTGVARSFTDNGDGTITDNATGLMWEKQSDDGTIHDKDNMYTWNNVFASKVATLNSEAFAGYSDWRVPNEFELYSLVNLGADHPATYSVFNSDCVEACTVLTCSCPPTGTHWSSSTYHSTPSAAWVVHFYDGTTYLYHKDFSNFVRAVRSGS